MLNVAHCFTELLLHMTILTEHIEMSVPSCHEFQNSFVVGTKLLCLQPFMRSLFHCLIIMELVTSRVLFHCSNNLSFVGDDCSA
jgi:hypothetical protein